jgi:hypothetical protein
MAVQMLHSSGMVGSGGGIDTVPILPCARTELPALAPQSTTPSRRSSITRRRAARSGMASLRLAWTSMITSALTRLFSRPARRKFSIFARASGSFSRIKWFQATKETALTGP